MGIGKLVKGACKAVGGAVKAAGKVAGKVLKSKVFNIATTAMMFVPGLNAAGVIGKGLAVLGKAQTIQKWLKTGMDIYSALKNGKGLTDAVKNLMSGKFQPLGLLSNLAGMGGPASMLANGIKIADNFRSKVGFLQEGAALLNQTQQLVGKYGELTQQFLPQGWAGLTSGLFGGPQGAFVQNITNFQSRIESTSEMYQELVKLLTPRPLQGTELIVRA
ncbi:hypothetical protein L0244_03300 [bacterium]|nr:hypothetical protein [bacterium]